MKIAFVVLLSFFLADVASAQQRWSVQASLSTNATSLPPGLLTRAFSEPVHPGMTLGAEYSYTRKGRHELFQTAKLGYFFHRYNQHALQVYSELGYRFHTPARLDVGLLFGGGYHHAIRDQQFFRRNTKGTYERITNWGQSHGLVSTGLEAGYSTCWRKGAPMRIFLGYQFWVQTHFVRDEVPVLPHTTLRIGASLPIRHKERANASD